MKSRNVWELVLKMVVAAITAALTALGTTSCMSLL
ncbi:MAG: smalltalk protein [Prevotella sp.]|nr:smalltalk protein [Prevotella sp.]